MRIQKSVSKKSDYLELGVIPSSSLERRITNYESRMALVRTVTTVINCIVSLCVLLKVFKVI